MFLGLGSNLGKSNEILDSAIISLGKILDGLVASPRYRSRPLIVEDQPWFINMAVSGYCHIGPLELLKECQRIETAHGRDREKGIPKGPRTLDIDILLYGEDIMDLPQLAVPHPGLIDRAFFLRPVIDLDASIVHPKYGRLLMDILEELPDQGIYQSNEG